MKGPLFGAVALGATALLLAGCSGSGSSASSSGGNPITITVLYGETGATAAYAKAFLGGVDAATQAINADGGVNGRKIVTTVVDDGTDPTKAVSLATQAIDSATPPDAIIPGATSAEALATLPLLSAKKIFSASAATSPLADDPAKYPYAFGVSALQTEGLSNLADEFTSKGIKTIAVVTSADAFGDSIESGIKSVAAKAGVKIIDNERPAADALDYTVELQRAKNAKPDAIFFDMAVPASAGLILTARDTVGATDIPIYGGTAVAATNVASLVSSSAIQGCLMPVFSFTVKSAAGSYLKDLYSKFENIPGGVYTGGLGWDSVHVIAEAFAAAGGKTTAPDLASALEKKGLPANYSAMFPTGTSYSAKSHFPTVTKGSLSVIPCSDTIKDGLWVSQ